MEETQIKITMIYHLIPLRRNTIKKEKEITSVGKDVEKRELKYNWW